jgi:uncharacterized protein YqhQ
METKFNCSVHHTLRTYIQTEGTTLSLVDGEINKLHKLRCASKFLIILCMVAHDEVSLFSSLLKCCLALVNSH